jgi:hypothetical protein
MPLQILRVAGFDLDMFPAREKRSVWRRTEFMILVQHMKRVVP